MMLKLVDFGTRITSSHLMKIRSFLLEDSRVSWGTGFHKYRVDRPFLAFARLWLLRILGVGDDFFAGTNEADLSRSDSTTFVHRRYRL